MAIKVKTIGKPTKKIIRIECPNCKTLLDRCVPIEATKGKDECSICGAKLYWEDK